MFIRQMAILPMIKQTEGMMQSYYLVPLLKGDKRPEKTLDFSFLHLSPFRFSSLFHLAS